MAAIMTKEDRRRALLSTPAITSTIFVASAGPEGMEVTIGRLSVVDVFNDISDFPELEQWLFNQNPDGTAAMPEMNAKAVRMLFGRIGIHGLSTVIARGIGYAGDAEVIESIKRWSDDDRLDVLMAITDLTMPRGIADFFGRLWLWWARLESGNRTARQTPKSQQQPQQPVSEVSSSNAEPQVSAPSTTEDPDLDQGMLPISMLAATPAPAASPSAG